MIRLCTLGRLTLEHEGGPSAASVLAQPKRLALLVYLAAGYPPAPRSRDTLIALLWPELDQAHARTALRQCLLGLRRSLGAGVLTGKGEEQVGVDSAWLWCDAAAFGAAIAAGRPAEAVALYGGAFMDGFHVAEAPEFERWLERERRRLEVAAAAAAWRLVDAAEAAGNDVLTRHRVARALELAPYDEPGFRRYLQILQRQGDPGTAVTAFAAFAGRLEEELGVEPSAETIALIREIRSAPVTLLPGTAASTPRSLHPISARATLPPEAPSVSPEASEPANATKKPVAKRFRWLPWAAAAGGVALIGALTSTRWRERDAEGTSPPRTAIAVLPFRNLSADSAHAYFAAALHDELLSQLSRVGALEVRGRTSVSGYGANAKPLRQVAEELAVGSVVEGSVRIVGDRLQVVMQLLDPVTQQSLLLEKYDRRLDDAFAVQSEIVERIVASVGARLTAAELGAIRAPPTRDPAAYQLYLQALEYARRPGYPTADLLVAVRLYERALALDSTFALAHASLSATNWFLHNQDRAGGAARLARARREAETSLRLDPDLPQGHLARGLAEYVASDNHRAALDEFRTAVQGAPNDPESWGWIARMHRHLGNWDSASAAFRHALTLDPRNANLYFSLASMQHYLHRYDSAIATYRRVVALAPDYAQARIALAWSYVLWTGQMDTLRATLGSLPLDGDPGGLGTPIQAQRLVSWLWGRQPDSILAFLAATRGATATPGQLAGQSNWSARAHLLKGDTAAARASLDSILSALDSAVRASPGDWGLHGERGLFLAARGRRADALREAEWLERSDAYRRDRYRDGWVIGVRAVILVQAGATEAALVELERALARPSVTTVHTLRLDPFLDPIRGDPRFQALLVKYAMSGGG